MWQKIQNSILVTVITLLIWLYAESSTLQQATIHPSIEFVHPTGRELLIDPKQPDERVSVDIEGPTSQLAELNALLELGPIQLELLEGPQSGDPIQPVNLLDKLTAYLAQATPGITVIDVKPAFVEVRVERYVKRMLPIEVRPEGDVLLSGQILTDPTKAEIKLTARQMAQLDPEARIIALIGAEILDRLEMDLPHTETVKLLSPLGDASTKIDPETADVTFTITRTTKTLIYKLIPIQLQLTKPMSADGVYVVIDLDVGQISEPARREIKLEGPTKTIEQIEAGELKITAVLVLDFKDLEAAIDKEAVGQITVKAPPDVIVLNPPRLIRYTVIKLEAPIKLPVTPDTTPPNR